MLRLPVSTLRIWERRYRVVGPAVTASGHRLYSGADFERLLLIKQLVDAGHAIGSLARLTMAALLEVADTRAALQERPAAAAAAAARPRAALLGLGLPRRLGALALRRQATWADLAAAESALDAAGSDPGAGPQADLLVAELATLQPESAGRLLALAQQLGARRGVLIYGFGSDAATQRLRQAGWRLHRAPLADAELCTEVAAAALDEAGATAGPASPSPPLSLAALAALAALAVPPRRFDDDTLARWAAAPSRVACECPRHVAELVTMLASFETYSAECARRGAPDDALHRHLQQVAGVARALLEDALQRVTEAEHLPLPAGRVASPA